MEKISLKCEVSGERIDKFICESLDDLTRSAVQKLIEEGNVFVNSAPVSKNYKCKAGDEIEISLPVPVALDVEAQDIRGIPEDITIVCNAFAGNQKLATEYEYLYKKSFWWKDSLEVYFDKKNLATRTTRIEIFCKRG